MHYFGIPDNTQSMIAYKLLRRVFLGTPVQILYHGNGLLKCHISTRVLEMIDEYTCTRNDRRVHVY